MRVALLVHRIERSILRAETTVSMMVCTLMLNDNGTCCQDDAPTLRPSIALDAQRRLPFSKQHTTPMETAFSSSPSMYDEHFVDVRCMFGRVILVVEFLCAHGWRGGDGAPPIQTFEGMIPEQAVCGGCHAYLVCLLHFLYLIKQIHNILIIPDLAGD